MAQLMSLPLTVSCSSKIQVGFTFLVPADPDSSGQRAVKRVCVCVGLRAAETEVTATLWAHLAQKSLHFRHISTAIELVFRLVVG